VWARFFQNQSGYTRPFWIYIFANLYGPFLGAGIRLKKIAPDYKFVRVEMPLTWYNRNYVGTQFGGSIYAMTDPIYMLMLIQILGRDYIVWDKAANIDFIKPGRMRLVAEFRWTEDEIALIRERTKGGQKYVFDKEVLIHDTSGLLCARVIKTLYVRKKEAISH
jgi:acyl-coenzyme A thioesterase PaaI-like protein